MVNLQRLPTTDTEPPVLLDEEDQRERVLLVVVAAGSGSVQAAAGAPTGSESLPAAAAAVAGGSASQSTERGATYAIPVASVHGVIGARTVTPVPGAPALMLGLVNVRGIVVTVLDLAGCLGASPSLTPAHAKRPASIVLLERGARVVGIAVERVLDVRVLDDGPLAPSRAHHTQAFVRGIGSAGGML